MPPRAEWDPNDVDRVLELIRDLIKELPKPDKDFDYGPMLIQIGGVSPEDVSQFSNELKTEYLENRTAIDKENVIQLFDDMYDLYVQYYVSETGYIPSEENRIIAASVIQTFFMNDDLTATLDINGEVYSRYDLSITSNTYLQSIMSPLDFVMDESRRSVNSQPLYPDKASQIKAFMRGASEILPDEIYGEGNRLDPVIWDQVEANWSQIKTDLFAQGGGATPAIKTITKRLLDKGSTGSAGDRSEYGWVPTLFSNNPLSKEQYRDQFEAQEQITGLTEAEVSSILSNPQQWASDYYGNPRLFPQFKGAQSTEASNALTEWISDRAYDIEKYSKELATQTTPDGALRWTPEDIARLTTLRADLYTQPEFAFNLPEATPPPPNIAAIDAEVEAKKSGDKSEEKRITAINKFISNPSDAVNKYIASTMGVGVTVPEYAKNLMASSILKASETALEKGLPTPVPSELLSQFDSSMPLWINRQNTDTEAVAESLLGLDIFTPKEIKSNFTTAITNLKSLIDTNMENNIWEGTASEYGQNILSKVNVTPSGELAPYPTPLANYYSDDAIVEQTGWEPGTWDSGIHQKTTKRPGFTHDGINYLPSYSYSGEFFHDPTYQVTPVQDIPEPVERMEEWRRELTGEELLNPNMPASIWEGSGTPPPPSFGYGGAPYMPQKEVFTQQQVESAFLPQFAQRPEMYQYVSGAIPQLLSGIQGAPIGTTLPDYTELQMPSLESSFAQTPGYYREQARTEQDLLREEADVERAASVRRGQLRSGAQNIFGRRE